jgi:hypothetical protein
MRAGEDEKWEGRSIHLQQKREGDVETGSNRRHAWHLTLFCEKLSHGDWRGTDEGSDGLLQRDVEVIAHVDHLRHNVRLETALADFSNVLSCRKPRSPARCQVHHHCAHILQMAPSSLQGNRRRYHICKSSTNNIGAGTPKVRDFPIALALPSSIYHLKARVVDRVTLEEEAEEEGAKEEEAEEEEEKVTGKREREGGKNCVNDEGNTPMR